MSYAFWKSKIVEWQRRYPIPSTLPIKGQYDPTRTKILAASCVYCGSKKKVHRHHKGHEFIFACIMPEKYAERYIRFEPENTVPLCRRHHSYIHTKYELCLLETNSYVLTCKVMMQRVEHKKLEMFRLRMVATCELWLLKKQRTLTGKLQGKKHGN